MQGGKELVKIVMPDRAVCVHRLAAALRVGQREKIPDAVVGVPEFMCHLEKLVLCAQTPKPLEPHDGIGGRADILNLATEQRAE